MRNDSKHRQFERVITPHMAAAYNLARWLIRNEQDAEDVVQEACLRAYRHLDGFRGGDGRAWLLTILRNCCYSWIERNRGKDRTVPLDVEHDIYLSETANPEKIAMQSADLELVHRLLEELPVEFREVLVLREMEQLSYKEIAHITDLPIGTVMSRLGRARARLQSRLANQTNVEAWK